MSPSRRRNGSGSEERGDFVMTLRTSAKRAVTVAAAVGFAVLAGAAPVSATSASAAAGDICLWSGSNYSGNRWCWRTGNGYVVVPRHLHDIVGSFLASTNGRFITRHQVSHP